PRRAGSIGQPNVARTRWPSMSLSTVFSGGKQRLRLTLVAYAARRACLFRRCERMEPTYTLFRLATGRQAAPEVGEGVDPERDMASPVLFRRVVRNHCDDAPAVRRHRIGKGVRS